MSEITKIERTGEWSCQDILFANARVPESQILFLGSSDFHLYEFDLQPEKPERVVFTGDGHQSYVTSMALVETTLVTGSYDGQLIWWNTQDRSQTRAQLAHDRWIRYVIAVPERGQIVSVADDMQCKVWDIASGELIKSFTDHAELTPHNYPSMLYAVAVSADSKLIATGDRTGHVAIWDAQTFEKLGEVEAPTLYTWDPKARRHSIGGIRSLAFSPNGTRLAVGGIGKIGNIDHLGGPSRLEIFDWEGSTEPVVIEDEEKKGLIEQMLWRPDGETLFGVGGDHRGFVNLYDVTQGKIIAQAGGSGHLHAFSIDESWTTLFTAGHQRVERWGLVSEAPVES